MDTIVFRDKLVALNTEGIIALYKECTPSVLVVTDTLTFNPADGFGLTQFVGTLKAGHIHGMTPKVTTASRSGDAFADIPNFTFNDPAKGLVTSRYDVVFIFGREGQGAAGLAPAELASIATFMEAGGGVFATGDHDTLGAPLCGDIPRVRAMRKWKSTSTPPSASDATRLSTNLSGPDEVEEFNDQSNIEPQRLYVNYRTTAGGLGNPHPLLQLKAPRKVLEVFPDHPHEGECLVPTSLGTSFTANGSTVPEWPNGAGGSPVQPEIVAMSVSNGSGFTLGNKGRVSVDSTWHHFININLDGTGEPGFRGLQTAPGVDSEALTRIREHHVNIATWLMPKKVRKCARFPYYLSELVRYPLAEELNLLPLKVATAEQLQEVGTMLTASLLRRMPAWQVDALVQDTLEDAAGEALVQRLNLSATEAGMAGATRLRELGMAALGGALTGVAQRLSELPSLKALQPHETLEPAAALGASQALAKAVTAARTQWQHWDAAVSKLSLTHA
jgi:hypothetical protein